MDHGQGSGAARSSEERQRHRGREDFGPASQEEWSIGKVGVTATSTFARRRLSPLTRDHFRVHDYPRRSRHLDRSTADVSSGVIDTGTTLVVSRIPLSNRRRIVVLLSTCSDSRLADKVAAMIPRPTYSRFACSFAIFFTATDEKNSCDRTPTVNEYPHSFIFFYY